MPKTTKSLGQRLILTLADLGGSATLTEITRNLHGHWSAAQTAEAKDQTTGLVEFIRCHGKTTNRPIWRATLTLRGQIAATILKPGFKPHRFAAADLQAGIHEMQAEREPWAMSLLRNEEDAREWRAHVAIEKKLREEKAYAARRRSEKRKVKHVQSVWFKEQVLGKPPEESNPAEAAPTSLAPAGEIHSQPDVLSPASPTETPTYCRRCAYCERCHLSSDVCPCGTRHVCGRSAPAYPRAPTSVQPTAQSDADDSVNRAKIEAAGYTTAIRGANQIAYGGAIIGFAEFVQRMQL